MSMTGSPQIPLPSAVKRLLHPDSRDRFQIAAQLGAIVIVLAYAVLVVTVHPAGRPGSVSPYDWAQCVALLIPVLPVLVHLKRRSSLQVAWVLVGLSIVLFDLASVLRLLNTADALPFSTVTAQEAILIVSFAALTATVILVMQQSFGPRAFSVRLDALIAGSTLAALASTDWLPQRLGMSGRPLLTELNLFNPTLVALLLVLLVAGIIPRRLRLDSPTVCLFVGLLAIGLGDYMRLSAPVVPSLQDLALVAVLQPVGMCCFAWATWSKTDRRDETREILVPPRGLNFVPVAFGALAIALLTRSAFRPMAKSTIFMALGALAVVIVRMFITQGEVRQLGRSNFVDARTDHVTDLANRRAFLEDGESKLAALRPDQQLAIVLIDLDGFKEVNDSLGHAHGDELLKVVGRRFARKIDDRGSVARVGGDEFACTLVLDADNDPLIPAHDLAKSLADPISIDGTKVRVSASIGVAVWPQHGTTHAALLRSADVAMYEAKRSRAAVRMYSDGIDGNSRERLTLINDLRTVIERHRLTLHFQPTRHVLTGSVHGVEALVRWNHPTLGLLQPDDFIPLAESAGLISPLTRTVLDLAITELSRLDRNGHLLQMNVNISQWDLIDPRLPESISRMLDWFHLPAARLVLEVTESSLVQDPALAKRSIERLRSAGVKISIDDFGVGYSSMSQLLELPVDELKIDKSFVLAVDTDSRAISLIRSMIEMARALGLTVVAEGVETLRSFDSLSMVGADVIQGVYVAPPLTSAGLDAFLLNEVTRHSAEVSDSTNVSGSRQ